MMFSRRDAWNKTVSCATTPILERKDCCKRDFTLMLSTKTDPVSGSYMRRIKRTIVVFPLPLGPTSAAVFPAGMLKLTFWIPPTSTFSMAVALPSSLSSSLSFLLSLIQKLAPPLPPHTARPRRPIMPLPPQTPFPCRLPCRFPPPPPKPAFEEPFAMPSGPPKRFRFALTLYRKDTLSNVISPLEAAIGSSSWLEVSSSFT
mmetsp:Transcript_38096/g.79859  ORF Transcript_38096/g.79859 Transcript_38096/m.79859 type:complete len:202 (-) Transcript_38096:1513-2118(-)